MKSTLNKAFFIVITLIFSGCNETQHNLERTLVSTPNSCYSGDKFIPNYNLSRFENDITNLEQIDIEEKNLFISNPIIFVGSSTIKIWNTFLKTDFPNLPVIGHGFGGSTFPELIYYRERLITRYNPKSVVIYCENDLFTGQNKTEEQVLADICYLVTDLHQLLPKTKFFLVSLKNSPARIQSISSFNRINKAMEIFCQTRSYTKYIDITYAMYKADKLTLDESIFQSDGLHMNYNGYIRWKNIIKPILEADYKSR
ncbi:hypothetical protein [Flectobacillus roseus]|uniref:hypothetical protein n=1 Tax=Flectobacillus roseus TaxID=502259 RepID=UPI0024B817ED|nr:hypothetical protein [Flectobacillus roseus]MDI9872660.1 hypothetical protein [Flectobacillus roseus]